jgi:flagellar protein FlaG
MIEPVTAQNAASAAVKAPAPVKPIASANADGARFRAPEGTPDQIAQAVENAMRTVSPSMLAADQRLVVERDDESGTFIYKAVDKETGEVERQFPSEAIIEFRQYLRDFEAILFDSRV